MILRHLIGTEKQSGFYVDVGAYHPVTFSNTQFFYLYGWRGINIEARPGSQKLFDRLRPRDINVEIGIGREPGELTYYFIAEDSPMNSFSRDFLDHIEMSDQVARAVPIKVSPLAEVLDRYLPEHQQIDFMNVDVEGHDLDVLLSNDWQRFRPRFVVVEDVKSDPANSEIVKTMRANDYEVCAQNVIILDKITEYFFVDRAIS